MKSPGTSVVGPVPILTRTEPESGRSCAVEVVKETAVPSVPLQDTVSAGARGGRESRSDLITRWKPAARSRASAAGTPTRAKRVAARTAVRTGDMRGGSGSGCRGAHW